MPRGQKRIKKNTGMRPIFVIVAVALVITGFGIMVVANAAPPLENKYSRRDTPPPDVPPPDTTTNTTTTNTTTTTTNTTNVTNTTTTTPPEWEAGTVSGNAVMMMDVTGITPEGQEFSITTTPVVPASILVGGIEVDDMRISPLMTWGLTGIYPGTVTARYGIAVDDVVFTVGAYTAFNVEYPETDHSLAASGYLGSTGDNWTSNYGGPETILHSGGSHESENSWLLSDILDFGAQGSIDALLLRLWGLYAISPYSKIDSLQANFVWLKGVSIRLHSFCHFRGYKYDGQSTFALDSSSEQVYSINAEFFDPTPETYSTQFANIAALGVPADESIVANRPIDFSVDLITGDPASGVMHIEIWVGWTDSSADISTVHVMSNVGTHYTYRFPGALVNDDIWYAFIYETENAVYETGRSSIVLSSGGGGGGYETDSSVTTNPKPGFGDPGDPGFGALSLSSDIDVVINNGMMIAGIGLVIGVVVLVLPAVDIKKALRGKPSRGRRRR